MLCGQMSKSKVKKDYYTYYTLEKNVFDYRMTMKMNDCKFLLVFKQEYYKVNQIKHHCSCFI